jgi:hypothetical protein
VSRRFALLVHVFDLSDNDIPDDVLIESEPAVAFLTDIKKIIVSMGCCTHFLRRENISVVTQSINALDQGFFYAGGHVQSCSLGEVPERIVNNATSQALFLFVSAGGHTEPSALPLVKTEKPRLGLHEFLILLTQLSQGFSFGSIDSSVYVGPSRIYDARGVPRDDLLDLDEYSDFDGQDHHDNLVRASEMGILLELVDTAAIRTCVS